MFGDTVYVGTAQTTGHSENVILPLHIASLNRFIWLEVNYCT